MVSDAIDCLDCPGLAPVVEEMREVFGLKVACRDPAVAAFGLENAVFPVGKQTRSQLTSMSHPSMRTEWYGRQCTCRSPAWPRTHSTIQTVEGEMV